MSDIAAAIWDAKYRLKGPDGSPVDDSPAATQRRVATAAAAAEAAESRAAWTDRFSEVLKDYRFLPAGRILAGAGSGRSVTQFNCFVMGAIPDSMDGIFAAVREAALTLQQGGGIGYDFSTLRPRGAFVAGTGADASGPVSFMEVWDAMCRTIMSAGTRRGAMMATLSCDHPDIEEFVAAKRVKGRLTMFNLSVLASDAFLAAVEQDAPWPLRFGGKVYKTLAARELWDRIIRSAYDFAEPGVIFIDRINATNNLAYCETISATNPCGEQPLPPYGACLLGAINLARLVGHPFAKGAGIDRDALRGIAATAVRFLDDIIDVSGFPLPAQKAEAEAKRRIGLGVTGLADALIFCGVRYGSPESLVLVERWLKTIAHAAYRASVELAAEKGAFPRFDAEKYLARPFVAALPEDIREGIKRHGIRNGLLTSIAPTGTISLYAGNVSSGIEPVFAESYTRKLLKPDGSRTEETVEDYAVRVFREKFGAAAPLPDGFVTAQNLTPEDHLKVQAAAQKYVDASISKTVNLAPDISFEDFKAVYRRAFDLGCKSCTAYRPNPVTGAVLSVGGPLVPSAGGPVYERPETLIGQTYKIRWIDSDHAFYITVNDIEADGKRRPFEVFINSKNMEAYAWTVALTRMISAVFRRGGDVSFVVEELKAVFDPRGGQWMEGHYVPSLLAAIGEAIERHLIAIGFMAPSAGVSTDGHCPRCGASGMVRSEGCETCRTCGYSKCS
jgi:ribonucleoside-diphosphate reductase alpha chain